MSTKAWIYESRNFDDVSPIELKVIKLSSFGLQTEDPFISNTILKKISLDCVNFDGSLDYLRYKKGGDLVEAAYTHVFSLMGDIDTMTDHKYYRINSINIAGCVFNSLEDGYPNAFPSATEGLYAVPPTEHGGEIIGDMPFIQFFGNESDNRYERYYCYQELQPLFLKVEINNGTDPVYIGYYWLDFTSDSNSIEFDDSTLTVTINANPIEHLILSLLEHVDFNLSAVTFPLLIQVKEAGTLSYNLPVHSIKQFFEALFNYIGFPLTVASGLQNIGFSVKGIEWDSVQIGYDRARFYEMFIALLNLMGGDINYNGDGTVTINKRSGMGSMVPKILEDVKLEHSGEIVYRNVKNTEWLNPVYGIYVGTQETGYIQLKYNDGNPYTTGHITNTSIHLFEWDTGIADWIPYSDLPGLISNFKFTYFESVKLRALGLYTGLRKTFTYKEKTHLVVSIDYDEESDQSELICRVID